MCIRDSHYTIQEGLDALRDVIYFIETYDVTTVRASTPMYLLARVIKSMGIKMVLSGEGADEVFGGYLYFHKAPNARAFHEETVRKVGNPRLAPLSGKRFHFLYHQLRQLRSDLFNQILIHGSYLYVILPPER